MGQVPFPTIVNLRGSAKNKTFMAATAEALGAGLPTDPNTSVRAGEVTALWLGPDEWWIAAPGAAADASSALAARLGEAVSGSHAAVTEVGDSRVCLRVSGPRTRDLLAKGSPLDLDPAAFGGTGHCAQTQLAKATVVLHQIDEDDANGPSFDIYVPRSFSDYLWTWLQDAAREYVMTVVMP
jgi:sarcosine oxidase subunit gamma